ncbi:SH3 domain-containing protein [Roseicyclus mahoneyensis]|jgi:hypothetical protein|uniref:SH3 domain-containing protein n=1 Tax=Roseicyclus mahoneyensis TaxID=164332 RepID=UPI000D6B8657|nr:SH3 domain-containing protein [Roseicyclus mahoneyensis]
MFGFAKTVAVLAVFATTQAMVTPASAELSGAINHAVIFEAPGLDQRRIGMLRTGERVEVDLCEGTWCFIRAAGDRRGWVAWRSLSSLDQWVGGTAVPGPIPLSGAPQLLNQHRHVGGSIELAPGVRAPFRGSAPTR